MGDEDYNIYQIVEVVNFSSCRGNQVTANYILYPPLVNCACTNPHFHTHITKALSKYLWVKSCIDILKMTESETIVITPISKNTIIKTIQYYKSHGSDVYMLSLDASKAFDRVKFLLNVYIYSVQQQFMLRIFLPNLNLYLGNQKLLFSIVNVYLYTVVSYGDLMTLKLINYAPHGKSVLEGSQKLNIRLLISQVLLNQIASNLVNLGRITVLQWSDYTSVNCEEYWPTQWMFNENAGHCEAIVDGRYPYYITLTVGFYFLPVTIMILSYSLVILRLWATTLPGEHSQPGRNTQGRAKRKVLKMVIVVGLMFVICWTPLQGMLLYTQCIHDINVHGPISLIYPCCEFTRKYLGRSVLDLRALDKYCAYKHFSYEIMNFLIFKNRIQIYIFFINTGWNYLRTLSITRRTNIDHTTYSGPEPVILLECNSFSKHRMMQKSSLNKHTRCSMQLIPLRERALCSNRSLMVSRVKHDQKRQHETFKGCIRDINSLHVIRGSSTTGGRGYCAPSQLAPLADQQQCRQLEPPSPTCSMAEPTALPDPMGSLENCHHPSTNNPTSKKNMNDHCCCHLFSASDVTKQMDHIEIYSTNHFKDSYSLQSEEDIL
ncbi:unnamed protein product, partial [Meganyctiphanes norvegica]